MSHIIRLKKRTLAQEALHLDDLIQDKSILHQPELKEVLEYKNKHIVDGLTTALDVDISTAENLFEDGLIWLWYCNNNASEGYRDIDDPILILDEVWHIFMLYTPYYMKFCQTYFGEYLHHMPTLVNSERSSLEINQDSYLRQKKKQLETIYELLGKDVFIRWYHKYPKIYSRENILTMRKK